MADTQQSVSQDQQQQQQQTEDLRQQSQSADTYTQQLVDTMFSQQVGPQQFGDASQAWQAYFELADKTVQSARRIAETQALQQQRHQIAREVATIVTPLVAAQVKNEIRQELSQIRKELVRR